MSIAYVLLRLNDYSRWMFSLMNDGYILVPRYTDMSCVRVVDVDWQLTCL